MTYLYCPLRQCDWRTVDRSHLGHVVLVNGTRPGTHEPNLVTRDALDVMQDELRGHLAQTHRRELQLMLAGADGGRGEPQRASLVQTISAEYADGVGDVILGVLVPRMRAQFAADLAKKGLRPLDPWPAVVVRRLVWSGERYGLVFQDGEAPHGMRELTDTELDAGRTPDLFQLELHTEAVPDARTVTL
jgi:hypothetical protein